MSVNYNFSKKNNTNFNLNKTAIDNYEVPDYSVTFDINGKKYTTSPSKNGTMSQIVSDLRSANSGQTGADTSNGEITSIVTTMPQTDYVPTTVTTSPTTVNIQTTYTGVDDFTHFFPYEYGKVEYSETELPRIEEINSRQESYESIKQAYEYQKDDANKKKEEAYEELKRLAEESGLDSGFVNDYKGVNSVYNDLYNDRDSDEILQINGKTCKETFEIISKMKELYDTIPQYDNIIEESNGYIEYINSEIEGLRLQRLMATDEFVNSMEECEKIKKNILENEVLDETLFDKGYDPFIVCEVLYENGYYDYELKDDDNNNELTYWDYYMYMTDDQRKMYHFMYMDSSNGGENIAERYLKFISGDVKQVKAYYLVEERLKDYPLDEDGNVELTPSTFAKVGFKGFEDGIDNFVDGFSNLLSNDKTISVEDYASMFFLQHLENEGLLKGTYEFSTTLGNMAPSILTSVAVSAVLTPAAGLELVTYESIDLIAKGASLSLMGLSAAGNAKHQALQNGADIYGASIYGMTIGLSEAGLEYFLGNIPGLSKESNFALKEILSEGTEEFIQEYIDAGAQSIILGQDFDFKSANENAKKSFIMGALMSSFMTGTQKVSQLIINGITYNVDSEVAIKYMQENPNATSEEILQEATSGEYDANLANAQVYGPQNITDIKVKDNVYGPTIPDEMPTKFTNGKNYNQTDVETTFKLTEITEKLSETTVKLTFEEENGKINTQYSIDEQSAITTKLDSNITSAESTSSNSMDIFSSYDLEITNMQNQIDTLYTEYTNIIEHNSYSKETIDRFNNGDINGLSASDIVNLTKLKNIETEINEYTEFYNNKVEQLSIMKNMKTNYENYDGVINFSSNIEVAKYFLDTKQYLFLRLKNISENTTNEQFINEFNSITSDSRTGKTPGLDGKRASVNYDVNAMLEMMNKYNLWTNEDIAVLNLANEYSKESNLTQEEIEAIHIFTSWGGPALSAYNRQTLINFKGNYFDGRDYNTVMNYLQMCINEFNGIYGKNFFSDVSKYNTIMDNIIAKSTVNNDIMVYRGCDGLFLDGNALNIADLKPGTQFNDAAHTSTSVSQTRVSSNCDLMLEIEVPAGTHAAYLESNTGVSGYNQQELLLPRNTQYEVVSYPTYNKSTGQYVIKVKVVN